MQIITIQDKQYAVGLWWQVPSGSYTGRKSLLQAARKGAAQQPDDKYDCVFLRKYQYGLGTFPLPKFQALPVLAAALRPKNLPFLGLFCLPNNGIGPLWWVCAITNSGIIAGDGDMLYDDKNAALQRIQSLQSMFGDIPADYECSTSEESVQALIPLLRSEGKLERLYADPRQKRLALAVLTVTAVLGGGLYAYEQYTAQQAKQLLQAQLLAQQKARHDKQAATQNNQDRYFNKHWEKAPAVRDVAEQCFPALYAIPVVDHGWLLDSATCARGSIVKVWAHTPGASYVLLPQGAILEDKTPTRALATQNIPALVARSKGKELSSKAAIVAQLYQTTQNIGASLRLQWAAAESVKVEDLVLVAPWVRCSWELTAIPNAALAEVVSVLDALPALTIEAIAVQKNIWNLKGYVYAQ